mmetsp:Transcript_38316/g.110703  ORF Transcript_38316/g.110703 Transcript_38316/m.110703 type:complete len:84 (-) Transcript_38316:94-345(-)
MLRLNLRQGAGPCSGGTARTARRQASVAERNHEQASRRREAARRHACGGACCKQLAPQRRPQQRLSEAMYRPRVLASCMRWDG